jgi:hypothetical protein
VSRGWLTATPGEPDRHKLSGFFFFPACLGDWRFLGGRRRIAVLQSRPVPVRP